MTADEREQRARAQVWNAVRALSDAELEHVQQQLLLAVRSSSAQPRKDAAVRITLVLARDSHAPSNDDSNQRDNDDSTTVIAPRVTHWSPSDLIHALLGHLHHVVQPQTNNSSISVNDPAATATDHNGVTPPTLKSASTDSSSRSSVQRVAKPTHTTSNKRNETFALLNEDFPSLGSTPSTTTATATAPHKPLVKPGKRRITTTLVSEQHMVTRPVRTTVTFPSLTTSNSSSGGSSSSTDAQSNPWAKRELLERRMLAAREPTPSELPASTRTPEVAKPHKAIEMRDSSAAKQTTPLFDDSPPNGPKRVQPFPVTASVIDATDCTSPIVTTPLKLANQLQPPPMLLGVKPKRPRHQSLLLPSTDSDAKSSTLSDAAVATPAVVHAVTADDCAANHQGAKLYAFLIAKRLVGSTCAELQLLMRLLFRSDCCSSDCTTPSEFCWRRHCLEFAATVLDALEPLLASLDAELLQLVMSSLVDAGVCAALHSRLQLAATRREELRVAESARIGCRLPIETKASAVRDFVLPFCEEVDSRLHYRSPVESLLYANREKVRDGFLALLRQFQRQQHALVGIAHASVAASAVANATQLLADVAPANRWWFAKFFVLELVQVGANPFGESDEDLVLKIMEDKLVVKNPDRLRKLHRRFSSQKQQQQQQPSGGGSCNNHSNNNSKNHFAAAKTSTNNSNNYNNNNSNNNSNSNSNNKSASQNSSSSSAVAAAFETSRALFAENQQFFFHFLHSCDSYVFSQLVKYQLEAQFQTLWTGNSNTSNSSSSNISTSTGTKSGTTSSSDPRKAFTDVVLKLKVVAKFLGYLRFAPHWHDSASQLEADSSSNSNPALAAAKKEAVATLERAESVGLDVKRLVEQSVSAATLSKCVPWLCDYLTMLALDRLSVATTYFTQLLVLLARIYHAPRLDALGDTGLCVALQLERVFHVLDVDIVGFVDDPRFHAPHFQPNASVLLALQTTVVESSLPQQQSGEDTLPFLYSRVFVQSCVSELEDLRGFLQTRAQPSHRNVKRTAAGGGGSSASARQGIPIRKLRPLQVVTDDNEPSDELLFTANANAYAQSPLSSSSSSSAASTLSTRSPSSSLTAAAVPSSTSSTTTTALSDADRLAESIFKVHAPLRKVVEFVVEVVATHVCEHVLQCVVAPQVDMFVSANARESRVLQLRESTAAPPPRELEAATLVFLELLETRAAQASHESAAQALATANDVCDAKVRAAVPPLLPSACHPTLAAAVVRVALARTRSVVLTLVPTSARSEFLKRVAARRKAAFKDATAKTAQLATAATTTTTDKRDSVVRTLSTMFDAHAGGDDASDRDELRLALKQTSAQVAMLVSSSRTAQCSVEDVAKRYATLARHVRSFTNRLTELLDSDNDDDDDDGDDASCPEHDDKRTKRQQQAVGRLHELPVWDTTWRVLHASLHVLTQLPDTVAAWIDDDDSASQQQQPAAADALAKTTNALVDNVVALVQLVATAGASDDSVSSRRTAALLKAVRTVSVVQPLDGIAGDAREFVQRVVHAPRARLVAAVASLAPPLDDTDTDDLNADDDGSGSVQQQQQQVASDKCDRVQRVHAEPLHC